MRLCVHKWCNTETSHFFQENKEAGSRPLSLICKTNHKFILLENIGKHGLGKKVKLCLPYAHHFNIHWQLIKWSIDSSLSKNASELKMIEIYVLCSKVHPPTWQTACNDRPSVTTTTSLKPCRNNTDLQRLWCVTNGVVFCSQLMKYKKWCL